MSDLGAIVRGRRQELGWSQSELAERAGLSRKWVYEFEAGNPTAKVGLVFRALEVLGLGVDVTADSLGARDVPHKPSRATDLDTLLAEYGQQ